MEYRLISLDLDGTLLGNDGGISDRNLRILEKAKALGTRVVICTGRIFAEAERLTEKVTVLSAIASSNGAYIVDMVDGNVLFKHSLEQGIFEEITSELDQSGVFYCVYGPDAIYLRRDLLYKLRDVVPAGEGRFCEIILVDDIRSDPRCAGIPAYKLNILDRDLDALARLRSQFLNRTDIELYRSSPYNLEITAKGVHKGSALKLLGARWAIGRDEIAALGDGENDIPMFYSSGLPIAMGNAPEVVRNAAARITRTNHEDGVAEALDAWVLASTSDIVLANRMES